MGLYVCVIHLSALFLILQNVDLFNYHHCRYVFFHLFIKLARLLGFFFNILQLKVTYFGFHYHNCRSVCFDSSILSYRLPDYFFNMPQSLQGIRFHFNITSLYFFPSERTNMIYMNSSITKTLDRNRRSRSRDHCGMQ